MKTRKDAVRFIKRKRKAMDEYDALILALKHSDPELARAHQAKHPDDGSRARLEALKFAFGLRRHDA
jgi:hypothetical protein